MILEAEFRLKCGAAKPLIVAEPLVLLLLKNNVERVRLPGSSTPAGTNNKKKHIEDEAVARKLD